MAERLLICTEMSSSELRAWALAGETVRERKRGLAIAGCLDGMIRVEAGAATDLSDQAVCDAIKRYNTEGVAGLRDRERSGRPSKLTQEQCKELREITVAGPDVEKEGLSSYTRSDLSAIAKARWKIDIAVTTIGRVLRDQGLSRQKARPSHPKKNAEAAEAFKNGSRRHSKHYQ